MELKKTEPKTLDQFSIKIATKHLESTDSILSTLIKRYGPCTIKVVLHNPFHAVVSSIISQQLSACAARAIKGRLLDLLGCENFTPEGLLKMSYKSFREAGLSRSKLGYIRGVAVAVRNGELDFASILKCEDEEVIAKLVSFSGIGRWTAEMFLIFGLGRMDVLSVNDAGLKKAFKITYQLRQLPSTAEMLSISEPWRPYRSVASWYLWRAID
jgi:DNA-3-methyladenine glycosylase II